ncbi:MAG: HAD-IIB family hydrolase [Nitrospirota bacterium]|nr:HAD-IIB family hydrolase [Nitrospirota bacterium]
MSEGLYIALFSVHGLIRPEQPELGRDPDTGGQIIYVLDLARNLAKHPRVAQVDLFTRQIFDDEVGPDYAIPEEPLGKDGARIVRIPCGPRKYIRKEALWPHLDEFVDRTVSYLRRQKHSMPHLFHSHYADAGYVGHELSRFLGVPLFHTGHSLGRTKRSRLLASGAQAKNIEEQYHFKQRIAAEERVFQHAACVICSTRQEADTQWGEYQNAYNTELRVFPPGTDTTRFSPPTRGWTPSPIQREVDQFLRNPRLPIILALARADPRKNMRRLIQAYAQSKRLREMANLVIIAGNRDDVRDLKGSTRDELTHLLLDVDKFELYGHIAMPKHHAPDDVPDLYRMAVRRRGVFVNPALTEPFGLTLIEAAATGLPIVATNDGGPRDIVGNCNNGLLVDPLNPADISDALCSILSDKARWRRFSDSGRSGVRRHYTWTAHVNRYVREIETTIQRLRPRGVAKRKIEAARKRMLTFDRLLVCDIDNTLVGDRKALERLLAVIRREHQRLGFVVATGRSLELTLEILEEQSIPRPDMLITSVGTEIHEGPFLDPADGWSQHIDHRWNRDGVIAALATVPGLKLQGKEGQRPYKVSYFVDGVTASRPDDADPVQNGGWRIEKEVEKRLRAAKVRFTTVFSHGQFLDVLPLRASKGKAVRYLADKWDIPYNRVLVAGDSGNDEEMLRGSTLGVVVGNYSPELEAMRGFPRVYFARSGYAAGILEGISHYGFLDPPGKSTEKDIDRESAADRTSK